MEGLLTTSMVSRAYDVLAPMLKQMADSKIIRHLDMYLVVMNPLMPFCGDYSKEAFEAAVLWEKAVTNPAAWANQYDDFACEKAKASWRTGLPTRLIRECSPHLLAKGNTRHGGSDVNQGLITACSGVEPWHDAMISGVLNHLIIGEANNHMQKWFIPGKENFIV